MDPLFIKPAEAAAAIGIGRTLFYKLVKAGIIPSCRVGRSIRVPVAALKAWAEVRAKEALDGRLAGSREPH